MGQHTQSLVGTSEGVFTVRIQSANPKTPDGANTFIFRRALERTIRKLFWLPIIDGQGGPLPPGVDLGDRDVRYTDEQRHRVRDFVINIANGQKGPVFNSDFGRITLGRDFVKEVQTHAISTRREVLALSRAHEIAESLVHGVASPNEEIERKNGILYFEYGFAKLRLDDGLYLVMGEVGVRVNSRPYYDQRVVAKFKADSEAPSWHGHLRIGESTFERLYDSRFRLIMQGVELYLRDNGKGGEEPHVRLH